MFDADPFNATSTTKVGIQDVEPYLGLICGDRAFINGCKDGWAHGCVNNDNVFGWFPHSFVSESLEQKTTRAATPQASQQQTQHTAVGPTTTGHGQAFAVFNADCYNARSGTEVGNAGVEPYLNLNLGDYVFIDGCEDGWAHGRVFGHSRPGWFPHSFIKLSPAAQQQQHWQKEGESAAAKAALFVCCGGLVEFVGMFEQHLV